MKFLCLLLFILFNIANAQKQVHIKYLNVRSAIANVYEDLYSNGTDVLSKQDGNIMWSNPAYNNNKKNNDIFYISTISQAERNFFFTEKLSYGEAEYFVHDKVPLINWKIDKESSKKILGYNCYKATAEFRGSPITAYFTEEIVYSIGPFKFFGLPGAILDIRADHKDYDLWKAVEINLDDKTNVNYHPKFSNLEKTTMEEFTKINEISKKKYIDGSEVEGSTSKTIGGRMGIEKEFEWETSSN